MIFLSVGCLGISKGLNVLTSSQSFKEKLAHSGNFVFSSLRIRWTLETLEDIHIRPSSKQAILFLISITIRPRWTMSMLTWTRTNFRKPSTFCKRSRKHWWMKLLSAVSSQVIVCGGRHRTCRLVWIVLVLHSGYGGIKDSNVELVCWKPVHQQNISLYCN